jgi:hypothetical protein
LLRYQQTQAATNPGGAIFNQLMSNIQQQPLRRPTSSGGRTAGAVAADAVLRKSSDAAIASGTAANAVKITHFSGGATISLDEQLTTATSLPSPSPSPSSSLMSPSSTSADDRKRRSSLTEGAIESKSIGDDDMNNDEKKGPSSLWTQVWSAATLRVNNNTKRR